MHGLHHPQSQDPPRQTRPNERGLRVFRDPLSIVLIVVIVVALGFSALIGGEFYARHRATSALEKLVECVAEDRVSASFGAQPLLLQLMTGSFPDISIETAGNQFREAKGMKVVDQQFTNDKATDFMAILTAVKAKNPDAIFYGGMDTQAGPMLRQMEQLGLTKTKFFGGDGICTAEIAKLSAGAKPLENVICAEGGASLDKMPGGKAWEDRYDKKYPSQFQIYSPYTYDATFVLVDAMKRANSTDPKKYIPMLEKTNYKGVTANIAFDASAASKRISPGEPFASDSRDFSISSSNRL